MLLGPWPVALARDANPCTDARQRPAWARLLPVHRDEAVLGAPAPRLGQPRGTLRPPPRALCCWAPRVAWGALSNRRTSCGPPRPGPMEPAVLASHNLQHHEPISFGIDQILSCPEPPGSGLGPGRASQAHGESAAFSGGFHGASSYCPAGSLGPLPSSSSVGPGGVIRVPAHRPLPVSPHGGGAPAVAGPSGLGGAGGLGGLTFPWMDSGRRFAKDRLTGEVAQPFQASCLTLTRFSHL